jgi:hypothetical protein
MRHLSDLQPIPRVNRGQFHPSHWPGCPRIVLGNVSDWKALQLWDAEYLKEVVGDRPVEVRERVGPPRNIYRNLAEGGQIPFSEYIDWVVQTADALQEIAPKTSDVRDIARAVSACDFERSYYLDIKLDRLSSVLMRDVSVPDWYPKPPRNMRFWCGVMGTSSGLHADAYPNCNVQIFGHKSFIVYPPPQSRNLHRIPWSTHSEFDPTQPDFDRFPLAKNAEGWECTLKPGESLYIPVGWFHQVTVTSAWAVNVNFFWPRPFSHSLATPALWGFLLMRGWRTLRDALQRRGN